MKNILIVISDNVRPRCGHWGKFPFIYISDRGRFSVAVECKRCKASWVWAQP